MLFVDQGPNVAIDPPRAGTGVAGNSGLWAKREHGEDEQPGRGSASDELDACAADTADVGNHEHHRREREAGEHECKLEAESASPPARFVRHVPSELDRPERELAGAEERCGDDGGPGVRWRLVEYEVEAVRATEECERRSDSGRRRKRDPRCERRSTGNSDREEHLRCRTARQEHDTGHEHARDEDGGDGGCYRRTRCA